jgi:hypothetical protein
MGNHVMPIPLFDPAGAKIILGLFTSANKDLRAAILIKGAHVFFGFRNARGGWHDWVDSKLDSTLGDAKVPFLNIRSSAARDYCLESDIKVPLELCLEVDLPPKNAPKGKINDLIREALDRDPHLRLEQIAPMVNRSPRRVRDYDAWKQHKLRMEREASEEVAATRNLAKGILAGRPANVEDPAQLVADNEVAARTFMAPFEKDERRALKKQYRRQLTVADKDAFDAASEEDQDADLRNWEIYGKLT